MSPRAFCQQRLHERNPPTDWTWGLVVLKHRGASWSLQKYNRRMAMKRLIPISTILYWFCYTSSDAVHPGLCSHRTANPVTTTSLTAPNHSWPDGEPDKIHSVLVVIPKIALCFILSWEWEPSVAFGVTLRKSWYRTMPHTSIFLM